MRKQIVKYLGLIGILWFSPTNAYSLSVKTDPWNNSGSQYFSNLTDAGGGQHELVPNIVFPFLPSGNILSNILASEARNAPDIGAVEGSILFLAQTFMGKGSTAGTWLWTLAMVTIIAGILLSGFLTFQAVSQGKKGIGEGIVSFTTKLVLSVVLFTFVVPNVPSSLIGMSNVITDQIDNWFTDRPAGGGGSRVDALEANFKIRMYAAQTAAAATAATMAATAKQALRDARGDAVANAVRSDSRIRAATDDNYSSEWTQVLNKFNQVTSNGNQNASGESIKEVNEMISKLANKQVDTVMERITSIIDQTVGNPSSPLNQGSTGDEELKNQIAAAPQSIDYSKFTYPARLIQTYCYIAFIYLSLSIWGMGFGAIVWVALYALPEEWNMGNLLVSGFKAGVAVLLGIVLVSIYLAASVSYTKNETEKGALAIAGDLASFLGSWASFSVQNLLFGGGGTPPQSAGAFAMNALSGITGMTPDQFIMGMLILTAPAQAALLVKGGNGVAESAKNALHAQGASSGSIGSMLGSWGGSSGVNASNMSSYSAGSIMQNRSDLIRQNFGPRRSN